MAYNKLIYKGTTLIDLTGDTVTPETLSEGVIAHDKAGNIIVGVNVGKEDSPLPIEIQTTAEMDALLTNATPESVGSVYKYVGTTSDKYENGSLYVIEGSINTYNITTNLYGCYGYSTNATQIAEGEQVTLYFVANSGYQAPTSIYVSGAEYSYIPFSDRSGGSVTISNPTSAVYVSISCIAVGNAYSITVVDSIGVTQYSTNPTQIYEGEEVTLKFERFGIAAFGATVTGAEYTSSTEIFGGVYLLYVTLFNPTGNVTVTISDASAPPLID